MKIIMVCFFQWIMIQLIHAQTISNRKSEIPVLDHNNIDSILNIRENHLIFFWGAWCQPCYESLDTIINIAAGNRKIKALFLAESHSSIPILEKVFRKYSLLGSPNVLFAKLHSENYTKNRKKNIQIFNRFICKPCVDKTKVDMRFSAVFIFDNNRKLLYYNQKLLSEEYHLIRETIESL